MRKLALITGASSGLGEELAKLLTDKGYSLILTGRNEKKLPPGSLTLDLSGDRKPLIELIHTHAPDLVINNAGYAIYGPALSISTEEQLKILEVNGAAAIEITMEAARTLLKNKKEGIILNVSSTAGEISMPLMAMYGAAKACLSAFSKSFDAEMRRHGIRILTALPGSFQSEFAKRASNGFFQSRNPLSAEAVAKAIWQQIEQKKEVQVIDWKNHLSLLLGRLLPRSITEKKIEETLEQRIADTKH